jgi:hypothetical protein
MSVRTPADPQESLRPTASLHEAGRPNAEGPNSPRPADHDAVAAWLAHVQAGRIGGNPPTDPAIRERVLANQRLICGDGTLPIW